MVPCTVAGSAQPCFHPKSPEQSQLSPYNIQNHKLTELLSVRGERVAAREDLSIFNDRRVSWSTCFSGYKSPHLFRSP